MSGAPPPRTLAVFLSNGFSLTRWRKEGLQTRELLLYRELLRTGAFERVLFFSYDPADRAEVERLNAEGAGGLEAATPSRRLGGLTGAAAAVWGVLGVFVHHGRLKRAAWLKTNQITGSWAAVVAAWTTGRPLLVRLGYLLSRRFERNAEGARARLARAVEAVAFRAATRVAVTSQDAAETVRADPRVAPKVVLLPTYVDVDLFSPKAGYDFSAPIVSVGRLESQKNVLNLVRACARIGRPLHMFGRGSLEAEVRAVAAETGAEVSLMGAVPNEELAERLRAYTVFAIPSHHEGLPKALIEAMALGLVCVGTRTAGITDLIEDERSGYLIDGTEPEAIAARLAYALEQRDRQIGRAARERINAGFSLARYVAAERAIYEQAR